MSGISSGVWELTWPQAPIPGPLLAQVWRTDNQRRYEILGAPVASMVGLVYINDGESAVIYNRLEEEVPATTGNSSLPFSPLSDTFARIEDLLAQTPQTAEVQRGDSYDKYVLHYPPATTLTVIAQIQNGIIVHLHLVTPYDEITLAKRSDSTVISHPPGLFDVTP